MHVHGDQDLRRPFANRFALPRHCYALYPLVSP